MNLLVNLILQTFVDHNRLAEQGHSNLLKTPITCGGNIKKYTKAWQNHNEHFKGIWLLDKVTKGGGRFFLPEWINSTREILSDFTAIAPPPYGSERLRETI